ncbi:Flp1 family type IVb pilin [Alkalihalobacillus sp. FSL R5-0424]
MNTVKKFFADFWKEEEGLQTLEILLIVAVIVVIALTFRNQIIDWVEGLVEFGGNQVDRFQEGGG